MANSNEEFILRNLSKRSERIPVNLEYVNKYSSWPAIQNPYHHSENPQGIINFGTAVSGLMDDVWLERLKSIPVYEPAYQHFRYYQFWGHDNFRQKLAQFMTCFFKLQTQISFQNLFLLNGAMVAVDVLGFLLADETDVFMCPVPGYNGYFQAGKQRWNIEIVSVPLEHKIEKMEVTFSFKLETFESILTEQKGKGKNVRAFMLNNPNNPLGVLLERNTIEQIMRICQRERIHLIVDEMYCMSVFDDTTVQFESVLQLQNDDLIDPNLLHVIWGFSKDLCLTSFSTGVIHTKNQELQLKLMTASKFQAVPLPLVDMLSNIISDIEWFRNYFVPENLKRLKFNYEIVSKTMTSLGIPTTKTKAGFFFLANFIPILKTCDEERCKAFICKLYENGVYVAPGWEMRAAPGWFRFVFTPYLSGQGLEEGLHRLTKTIHQWKAENP